MASMASNESLDGPLLERLHDVIESMTDSFTTYLHPTDILNRISSIDCATKGEILTQSLYDSKAAMVNFIDWLQDHEDSSSSLEFYQVLKLRGDDEGFLPFSLISPESHNLWRSVTDMTRLFVDLVDGNRFEDVTRNTVQLVIDLLKEKKILVMKNTDHIMEMQPLDAFMALIKSLRRNKPDWPFFVWSALETMHPAIFGLKGLTIENPSIPESEERSLPESDCRVLSVINPSLTESESHSVSSLEEIFNSKEQVPPRKRNQIMVKKEEMPEFQKLMDTGAIRPEFVAVAEDPKDLCARRKPLCTLPDHSDVESDDEDSTRLLEGTPDLNLRNYQKYDLSQTALEGRNVIISAPTGSGKTRVATHIIIQHLDQASEKNPKKVCFFARTVPLAVQQHKSISKYLPDRYKAFLMTGDSPNSMSLSSFLPDNDIIVLTPMILLNHFKLKLLKDITVFTLLVFDECHHTRKLEPYNTLMLSYLKLKHQTNLPMPQVLGLTASFPAEKAESVDEAIDSVLQVCASLDADDIATADENIEELKKIVPVPDEEILPLRELDDRSSASVNEIIVVMKKLEKEAQTCQREREIEDRVIDGLLSTGKIPQDRKSQEYNQWTVKLRRAAESVNLTEWDTPVRTLMIIADYLKHYNVALEVHDLVHLADVLVYLNESFKPFEENERKATREIRFFNYFRELKKAMQGFHHERNPNLSRLEDVLETYLVSEESRGIVFVKTRLLAQALVSWLNRCGKEAITSLKATIFTGTNASESEGGLSTVPDSEIRRYRETIGSRAVKASGMTQAQQDSCVESFRKGEIRLLIATSVGEEGIDVPECNLVIKYNHVGNEISTVQTKGRSRKRGGRSFLLAMQTIRERELVNRRRAGMITKAVERIRRMEASERLSRIKAFQGKALKELKLAEMLEEDSIKKLENKKFKMKCKYCRKIYVESDYLKTIFGVHRVVTDWNIWKYTNVRWRKAKYIDDVRFVGKVRCRGKIEHDATCNASLGVLVIFKGICFIAVGIEHFVFLEENDTTPQHFKKWKSVKYSVGDLEFSDVERYIEDSQKNQGKRPRIMAAHGFMNEPMDVNEETPKPAMENAQPGNEALQLDLNEAEGAVGGQQMQSNFDNDSAVGTDQSSSKYSYSDSSDRMNKGGPSQGLGGRSVKSSGASSKTAFSELSSYNSNDDHHQTKRLTLYRVDEAMGESVTALGLCDSIDKDTIGDAEKLLDDAPSLSSMMD